ncbi:hypothetical protein H0H92_012661 [Tricholoma furcatifolium]|nr:hypothetical protein H0H92_012661 [Tricholoma furcatifolium]
MSTSTEAQWAQGYGVPVAAARSEVQIQRPSALVEGYSPPMAALDLPSDDEDSDSPSPAPSSEVDLESPIDAPQAIEIHVPRARRGRAAHDISLLTDIDDEQDGGSPAPQAHLEPPIAAPQGTSHPRALVTPPPTESGIEYRWDYVYRYPQRALAHAPADLSPSAAAQANAEVLSPIAGRGRAAMDLSFICDPDATAVGGPSGRGGYPWRSRGSRVAIPKKCDCGCESTARRAS